MKIKRGDMVQVTVGADARPAPRRVLQVVDGGRKIVVEGVNRVYKHVKRGHPKSPQGGRLSREMPIDISNVQYYCDACGKGVRVGMKFRPDGAKVRFCKKCGKEAGTVSPPNPKYATPAGA
jgi:large subunit ribosomal protein L24